MNDIRSMESPSTHRDDIRLSDLLRIFKSYWNEIKRRWKVFAILLLLIGGYKVFRAMTASSEYVATLDFMVSEDEAPVAGGLGSLLGDIGLGSSGDYNLSRILQLIQSRGIFLSAIMDSTTVHQHRDLLANQLLEEMIRFNDLGHPPIYRFWNRENAFKNFRFSDRDPDTFTRLENAVLQGMHQRLPSVLSATIDENTDFMQLVIKTHNEDLSIELCNRFFKKLSAHYIERSTQKQQATFELLKEKVDSLQAEINNKEYQIARYNDQFRNIWQQKAKVPLSKIKKGLQMDYILLGEVIKNKELTDFTLQNITPFIQTIDAPIKPLPEIKALWWMELIKSIIIALLLSTSWIVASKWLRDALSTK